MGLLDRLGRFIDDVLLLPEEVRDTLDVAEQALEADLFAEAERLYVDVLADRPTLARASVGLAHARTRQGDGPGAWQAIVEARALSPDDGALALFAARLGVAQGAHRRASEAARDATRLYAREGGAPLAEAFALWAEAERGLGRPDRAARELQKAVAVDPGDVGLRVSLIEALAAAGQEASARAAAQGLERDALTGEQALRVGRALRTLGATELSAAFLESAVASKHAPALLELARVLLASGRLDEAESRARQAIARGAGAPALAVLGEVLTGLYRGREAAEVFAEGAKLSGDVALLRAAVRVAPRRDPATLAGYVEALEALAPDDSVARAGRAQVLLAEGALDEAAGMIDEADEEPRALLAAAELALRRGAPADAIAAVDRFVARAAVDAHTAVDLADAGELRRDALRALWRGAEGEVDLAAAIDAVARFGRERALGEVERAAMALRDELDRPLVLAVLGEFNAGKSTLINAFIGAEVAPMGVVPTTATLNLLRSGAERRVRVVRRDGSTRDGTYDDLRALLEEAAGVHLDDSDAVDRVEITLPGELLERVWILDAPGTNALDPSHERLAREAARRADAVLWVYDAGQAGKRTESEMQRAIASTGRLIVPVLNKAERLDDEARARVRRVLVEARPELDAPLFLSARRALRGRVAADAEEVRQSGFDALLAHLDRVVFSQSRAVKQKACAGRLLAILDGALATEAATVERFDRELAQLQAAGGRLIGLGRRLDDLVDEKLRWLELTRQAAFVEAADEVLGFVRPRRGQFSRHGAEPADRRFLTEMLERRLRTAVRECEASLVDAAHRLVVAAVDREEPAERARFDVGEPRALLARGLALPLSEYWGYQRGLFAAGSLDRFFDDFLPYAALEREPIANALAAASADPHIHLRPSLRAAAATLVTELEAARSRAADGKATERRRLTERVYGPLWALRQVLAELTRIATS